MGTRLAGKTALVTGATSNIGRSVAIAFGAEGAHVLVTGRDERRGAAVVERIRANGGKADFVAADLNGDPANGRELAERATELLGGRIDILVNNAAIATGGIGTVDTEERRFDELFAVNVKAPFFLTAEVAPRMAAAGGGTIVNLGSWVARLGIPIGVAYAATKGAMETLTRAWSAEFGPTGVRVNAISPGVVKGPNEDGTAHPGQVMMKGTPVGEIGRPESIAAAAVYLASDESAFVHGTVLDVDGGRIGVAVIAA